MRTLMLAATLLAGTFLASPALAQQAATEAPIPAEAGQMPAGELDGAVVPQTYRLDLTVDPTKERFSGHVEIDVDVKKAGRYVWMHGRDLKVEKSHTTFACCHHFFICNTFFVFLFFL